MKSKMTAIFATLMIALMAVGVSYALWFDTLTLTGTVNTGTVDVDWSLGEYGVDEEKDVSSVTAGISDDTLTVTIDNAYPCVTYYVEFDIHCIGSIPVHLYLGDYTIDPDWPIDDATGMPVGMTVELVYTEGTPIIDDLIQLHQGDKIWGELVIHFDNDMGIFPGRTYNFGLEIVANQYNE